jgi:hypothetical protein
MWHVWETRELHERFSWGDLRERDHLQYIRVDGIIILKWMFKTWEREAWTELICLRIETDTGLL